MPPQVAETRSVFLLECNETFRSSGTYKVRFDTVIYQCHVQSVDETWTISELVGEVERRIAALPSPKNGQVRAVPDDRTIRYYATIGLLDRPAAMRGRTALYGRKHVAQVVAIKRLQTMGRSLAEIQALWPTLDDATLSRMAGIELAAATKSRAARKDFWKKEAAPARLEVDDDRPEADRPALRADAAPAPRAADRVVAPAPRADAEAAAPSAELRIELAPNVSISIALSDDVAISRADVAAIHAAAAPLIAELERRVLGVHD